jgi:O-antigen ligase
MLLLLKGKERATFGFSTNRFGLFSAIILLSCIIFHHNLFGLTKKIGYAIAVFFWGFVTLVCFSGVILSQSRSAWAAVLIVMPVIFFIKKREKGIFKRINIKSSSFVLIALFLFFYLINGPSIVDERLLRIGNYASGFLSRLRLYDYALEQLKLNIWFGHGPGTSEILINSAGNQLVEEKGADHFHNIFLDTIVQLGVVGLIFYLIMFFIIFQNLKTARKYSLIREDFLLFSFGSLSLIFISGIFNQPLHSPHGTYLFALLVGVCCSYKFSIKSPV